MGNEGTIKLDKLEKKASGTSGAEYKDPGVIDEVAKTFEVFLMKDAFANGCPAYIVINGRKIKI